MPRSNGGIVSPLLLEHLYGVYPATGTVQTGTDARNDDGEIVPVWSNLASHVGLACRIAPAERGEEESPDEIYSVVTHRIALQGYYPAVTAQMRFVVGSTIYDIQRVEHDGGAETPRSTYLEVELKPDEDGNDA